MKKLLKCMIEIFGVCIGMGFIVNTIEKERGEVGWVDGHRMIKAKRLNPKSSALLTSRS